MTAQALLLILKFKFKIKQVVFCNFDEYECI